MRITTVTLFLVMQAVRSSKSTANDSTQHPSQAVGLQGGNAAGSFSTFEKMFQSIDLNNFTEEQAKQVFASILDNYSNRIEETVLLLFSKEVSLALINKIVEAEHY